MSKATPAIVALVLCLLAFSALVPIDAFAQSRNATRIHVVADGPWDRNDSIWSLFRTEMETLLGAEFGVTFSAEDFTEADWTVEGVRIALDAALSDPNRKLSSRVSVSTDAGSTISTSSKVAPPKPDQASRPLASKSPSHSEMFPSSVPS